MFGTLPLNLRHDRAGMHLSAVSYNVNGARILKESGGGITDFVHGLCKLIKRDRASVIGLQDIFLNHDADNNVLKQIRSQLARYGWSFLFSSFTAAEQASASKDKSSKVTGRGVALLVPTAQLVKDSTVTDDSGYFIGCCLNCGREKVWVYSVYSLPKDDAASLNQRRSQQETLRKHITPGKKLILMTDSNSLPNPALDSMNKKRTNHKLPLCTLLNDELDLTDAFRHCHPTSERYSRTQSNLTTSPVGINTTSSRIDQIWWSPALMDITRSFTATIDARHEVLPSDHYPISAAMCLPGVGFSRYHRECNDEPQYPLWGKFHGACLEAEHEKKVQGKNYDQSKDPANGICEVISVEQRSQWENMQARLEILQRDLSTRVATKADREEMDAIGLLQTQLLAAAGSCGGLDMSSEQPWSQTIDDAAADCTTTREGFTAEELENLKRKESFEGVTAIRTELQNVLRRADVCLSKLKIHIGACDLHTSTTDEQASTLRTNALLARHRYDTYRQTALKMMQDLRKALIANTQSAEDRHCRRRSEKRFEEMHHLPWRREIFEEFAALERLVLPAIQLPGHETVKTVISSALAALDEADATMDDAASDSSDEPDELLDDSDDETLAKSASFDGNNNFCACCKLGWYPDKPLVCCSVCVNSFHPTCGNMSAADLASEKDDWVCPECKSLQSSNVDSYNTLVAARDATNWKQWCQYALIQTKASRVVMIHMRRKLRLFVNCERTTRSFALLRQNRMKVWFQHVARKPRENPHAEHYDSQNRLLESTAARHGQTEHVHTEWCRYTHACVYHIKLHMTPLVATKSDIRYTCLFLQAEELADAFTLLRCC